MLSKFPNNDDTDIAIYYSDRVCPGLGNKTIVFQKTKQNKQLCYLPTLNNFFIALSCRWGGDNKKRGGRKSQHYMGQNSEII